MGQSLQWHLPSPRLVLNILAKGLPPLSDSLTWYPVVLVNLGSILAKARINLPFLELGHCRTVVYSISGTFFWIGFDPLHSGGRSDLQDFFFLRSSEYQVVRAKNFLSFLLYFLKSLSKCTGWKSLWFSGKLALRKISSNLPELKQILYSQWNVCCWTFFGRILIEFLVFLIFLDFLNNLTVCEPPLEPK